MDWIPTFPKQLVALINDWVVPLVILYNIIGWIGVPDREADRAGRSNYLTEDLLRLRQAIKAAWFAGLVVALVALWVIYSVWPNFAEICKNPPSTGYLITAATLGLLVGVVRFSLPSFSLFRNNPPNRIGQRRTLSWLVFAAVAVSCFSGALYYTSGPRVTGLIAAFYVFMLAGFAVALALEAAL